MKPDNISVLEMLSFIYEEMDVDAIEEKFIDLVYKLFSFDKAGLFFLKHRKGALQGKLCRGFTSGTINSLTIPVMDENLLTRPLITGFPLWNEPHGDDPFLSVLELENFAVIPIVNKKRLPCWQLKDCAAKDCPAYGKKWLRCWLVPNTKCHDGSSHTGIANKIDFCNDCKVFASMSGNTESVEGVLLVNRLKEDGPIGNDEIAMLSTFAYAVGIAINNSKVYAKTLRISIKDDLTGLHNRRYFNERLVDELERARRYDEGGLSILMADVDHFKQVNDTYGHPRGDDVLVWLAEVFREEFRHNDVVARYGGEEFAMILINTDKEVAMQLANRVRQCVEDSSEAATKGIKLTCCFGVATYGDDSYSMEGLLAKADKALYYAKAQGRNKVCKVQ